jgi:hypothetical protein
MHDDDFYFWHSPNHAEDAAQTRKLGGMRPKREGTYRAPTTSRASPPSPTSSVCSKSPSWTLSASTTRIARVRALIAASLAAAELLEVGEMEERLTAMEAAIGPRVVDRSGRKR